jgi:hypothetical protein
MGLILTDIKTSFGKYIDAGQGEKDVHNAFMYPENKLLSIFQTIETKDTQVRAGLMTTSRVAQAFKNKFSALGNSEFKPHVIDLFKHKMDVLLTPDDVENSWLGFLAGPGLKREEWPIGKYIAMELLKRYQYDVELDERVKGVYVAPADDETPAAAGTAMNGLRKIFTDHVTAGLITPYASGALSNTAATFVQQVEGFVKSIAQKERQYVKAVVLPMNKKDLYKEGMQSLYNQNYLSEADILTVRNNPGITVMFTESSDGTNLMWATMDGNARRYVKRDAKNYLMGVKDLRQLQVTTDHWEGLGFVVPQFAYVNDAGIIV